jgi:hypothetical protein
MEMWRNILKLQKGLRHFFFIVCDDESPVSNFENFIADNQADVNNFIILISPDKSSVGLEDEIKYSDLSEDGQEAILSKTVSFQGENLTVGNLIGYKPEEIIDFKIDNKFSYRSNYFDKRTVI